MNDRDIPAGGAENVQPVDTPAVSSEIGEAGLIGHDVPRARPPRVWGVFVTLVILLIGIILVQGAAVAVLAVWLISQGGTPASLQNDITEALMHPGVFISLAMVSQAVFLVGTLIVAYLSSEPVRQRLNWCNPRWPLSWYALVTVATFFPAAGGMALAHLLPAWIPTDPTVEKIYENMTYGVAVPFILCIALAPGFCEELCFRGYCQRRLLQRWSPFWAIGISSLLFALFHLMPHAVVFAFPVGIWLGVLAWRTGSVWPGIVCHAFLNGIWNVFQIGVRLGNVNEKVQYAILGLSVLAGLIAFAVSIRMLSREQTASAELTAEANPMNEV